MTRYDHASLWRSHTTQDMLLRPIDKEVHVQLPDGLRRRMLAAQLGQGTVEYVALVALVALIMVGVIAAMKSTQLAEGQQLGSLILRKIAEAVSKVHY